MLLFVFVLLLNGRLCNVELDECDDLVELWMFEGKDEYEESCFGVEGIIGDEEVGLDDKFILDEDDEADAKLGILLEDNFADPEFFDTSISEGIDKDKVARRLRPRTPFEC